jgi:hypothetical protein
VLAATGQLGMAAAGQIRLAVVTRGPAKKPSSDIDDGLRIAVERGQPSTTVPEPEMVFVLPTGLSVALATMVERP